MLQIGMYLVTNEIEFKYCQGVMCGENMLYSRCRG